MKLLTKYLRDPVAFIDDLVTKNELGHPFHLFDHQREILRVLFAFDADGRLPWDTILWSSIKKDGKSFVNALVCTWWGFTQEPPSEIDVRSNDMEQSLSRVFRMIVGLLRHNPVLGRSAKIQSDRILLSNGTIIRAIPADWKGESGGNQGMLSFDELWGYSSEAARRSWDEAPPVPTKKNSVRWVSSYAGIIGESDLLEEQYKRAVDKTEHPDGQGERIHPTLPIYANRTGRIGCYWDHEGKMPWQTPEYLAARRRDQRPASYLRQCENRWVTGMEEFITLEMWDRCVDPALTPLLPTRDRRLFVGWDLGTVGDNAAVVGVIREGNAVILAVHRIWRPSRREPLDISNTVEKYLRELREHYLVDVMLGDPWQAHQMCTVLEQERFPIRKYNQTQEGMTRMGEVLFDLLTGKNLRMYPSEELKAQALSTVAIESSRGWRIAKEKTSRKIDAIIALSMACVAAVEKKQPMGAVAPPLGLGTRVSSQFPSESGPRGEAAIFKPDAPISAPWASRRR